MLESAAVAARFPDPPAGFRTPAFDPGRDAYTSNAELHALLEALADAGAARGVEVTLLPLGSSQEGTPIEAVRLARAAAATDDTPPGAEAGRPTVLLVGQQHGNEPAAGEALIVIAQDLAGGRLAPLLDRIDVVILPRANPDGAAASRRATASGVDANRDHLLLRTPEAQAQASLMREFAPLVVVDAHEYAVGGRWLEKFGTLQRHDALLQYATAPQVPAFVTKAAEEWFRAPLVAGLTAAGLSTEWYHTTSDDLADRTVSMGGSRPDNGRNVNGLRHAVSLLVETRGVGIGRQHLGRRVRTHAIAIANVLTSAAARADDLVKLRRYVDHETSALACQGEIVVDAGPTPSEYTLRALDPASGTERRLTVTWNSALQMRPLRSRARPCGYWLDADAADAVQRLQALGLEVSRIDEAGELRGETYRETARDTGAAGGVPDAGGVLRLRVQTVPALLDVDAGGYYVGLDQPLADLAVAALEPDTPFSYAAHRVVGVDRVARVLVRPAIRLSPLP